MCVQLLVGLYSRLSGMTRKGSCIYDEGTRPQKLALECICI